MIHEEASYILKYLIAVTDKLIAVAFIMGLFLSAIPREQKKERYIFYISNVLGLLLGFILFLVKVFYTKETNIAIIKLNRQVIVVIFVLSIIASVSWLVCYFVKSKKWFILYNTISGAMLITFSLFYISPQIYEFTGEFVYFGENSISTAALLRAIGFTFGIVVCLLIYISTYKVGKALPKTVLYIFGFFGTFIYGANYGMKAVKALQRMHIIELSDIVFKIMIFEDNHYKWLIYSMLFVSLVMIILVVKNNWNVTGEFKNNAMRRKQKAKFMKRRRWSYCLLTQAIIGVLVLSVGYEYDTKEVELTPPQPYKLQGDLILIPTEDVSDGHLHRFSYKTPNGYDVRFIAVKKPIGSSYGLGLDACEICGIAGYFERGDDVVCKRCDVVMNKATIGFKGGCNPIPFPYEIKDATIIINVKELEREEKRFK